MKNLINFRQLSLLLTGNPDTIRENRIPKKYRKQVDELIKMMGWWYANL